MVRRVGHLESRQRKVCARIQCPVAALAEAQPVPAGPCDHRGVVGIEARARDGDARDIGQAPGRARRQRPAAGDAAAQNRSRVARGADGALQFRDQHVEHRILKAPGEVRPVAIQIVRRADGVQHGSLQAGERELEPIGDHRAREVKTRGVTFARQLLDRAAARVAEAKQRRDLVERLAGRVIARLPEEAVAAPGGNVEQQGVAARHEQGNEGRRQVPVFHGRSEEVPFHMMHADQRAIAGKGERLGKHHADEQRAGEARTGRDGHRVDRAGGEAGFRKRAIHDGRQRGEMRAAGQLRDDPAEHLVNVLRQNDEARQLTVHENGGRSLVARRLDAEDGVSHCWADGWDGGRGEEEGEAEPRASHAASA